MVSTSSSQSPHGPSPSHRLRIRILRILKFPKIHNFFYRILKLNFKIHKIQIVTNIAAEFQQTLRRNTAPNYWFKNSVM